MSVVPLQSTEPVGDRPVTGGAMDRVVARGGLPRWAKLAGIAAAVLLAALAFWFYAPRGDSQTVSANRLTISTVRNGTFDDFIPLRARVTPLLTVFLDAIEGGRAWPAKLLASCGVLLSKGKGQGLVDQRVICLLPRVVRAWSRTRRLALDSQIA